MRLTNIHIKNVKGISNANIDCDFLPNHPNFLVAPNGIGKSSLATAFKSLNRSRMKLGIEDFHRGYSDKDSFISIRFDDGKTYKARATRTRSMLSQTSS